MKTHPHQWLNVMLLLALLLPIAGHPTAAALSEDIPTTSQVAAPVAANASETLRNSPVMFIENVGQFAEDARFQVRGGNGTLWLADDALWITIVEPTAVSNQRSARSGLSPALPFDRDPESEIENRRGVNLRLSFPNANPHPRLEPFDRLETTVSYFLGNDPDGWRPAVPVWGGVRYVDLYPGIDLEVTSEDGQFVQRLHAQPGADLSQVQLRVEGAEAIELAGVEGLRLSTAVGDYILPLLTVADTTLDAHPAVSAVKATTFDIAAPLILSPRHLAAPSSAFQNQDSSSHLLYGTFLGGGDRDEGYAIAVDGAGAAYVTGQTRSSEFPVTPGAFDAKHNGSADAFVVKLNLTGSRLVYATFLGGGPDDYGYGIAVDDDGNAYVTGQTGSRDFPVTPGAFDTTHNSYFEGYCDVFVAKLNPTGSGLVYSTFLGGSSYDYGYDIAVDDDDNAYITGETRSSDFPATQGAFNTTHSGDRDAFVVKLNSTGSDLVYANFLGGSNLDVGHAIKVDSDGNAYITGETRSSDFPVTSGAFSEVYNGGVRDAFVAKLNPTGSDLAYATFLGGSDVDYGYGIAVDGAGNAYVTGTTISSNFPVTPGAFDETRIGSTYDAFVTKLNPTGSSLVYSTFLGAGDHDYGYGIAVDDAGNAYITGETRSSDFPVTPEAFDETFNGDIDAFIAKLNPTGNDLVYATFLGGSDYDYDRGIAVDDGGYAYIIGWTRSSDFPVTPGAFDRTRNGVERDAFVAKLDVGTISGAIPSGLLTLLSAEAISPFRPLVITAQVDNAGLAQQEFDLAFHLWHDNTLVDTQFFVLPVNSGATVAQAANFGLRAIGRYRVEAVLAANSATLATQSRDIIVVDAYAARIILDYAGDLQAAAHAELDDIAYVPSYALSDEIVSLGLDKLQDYAIGKFADLAAPIQEAGDLPLSTSDGAIAEIRDKLGRVRQFSQNLTGDVHAYVREVYGVTLPDDFDPLNPNHDPLTDPIKEWLIGYLAGHLSDKIISPLWVNGPRNDVDDRHLAFEDFLLSHPVAAEPQGLAGQMQRGRDRILNVVEGDALITLGPYNVLWQTLQYDLTLQEQENKRQQIHTFDDILKMIIPVLVIIGVVIIVLLMIGAISSSGVLAAVVGPIIWKIVKILHAISKIVPMATALLAVSMLFTASIVAPHVPQYHDETLDAAEMLIGSSGLAWLHSFDVAVRLGQAQLTVQVDGPEVGESQVLVETVLYSVDGRIIHIVWSPLQIQAGQQALLSKDVPLVPGVYRAVTTLYAEGEVAAAETVPFQMSGPSVELDLHLNQSHLNPGDLVAATVTLTNTSPISDVNDLTLIVESTDGVNFDAWPISLMAGGTQQITYTFIPTTTGACVLRAWLGIGFNTLAQQDVAYTVGGGPAVALNTHVAEVYLPGAAVTLPLTLTNVGDTAATVSITIQTNDRLQTGVVFSATQLITVPADSMVFAGAQVLPNAEPGLYSVWLMMNGAAYDAYDFAVSATDTLFGLLTLGELYAQIGQNVPVTATVHTASNVLTDATITVTIQSPNGTAAILPMTWVSSGIYRADYIPPITGTYSLELAVTQAGHRTVGDRSFFVAETPTLLIPTVEGQPQAREIRPITVTVYNENGTPVQGAMVVLSGTEEILRGETDEAGRVLLRTFPPDVRPYVLATERMGYAGATMEVAVAWFQIYLPLVLRQ